MRFSFVLVSILFFGQSFESNCVARNEDKVRELLRIAENEDNSLALRAEAVEQLGKAKSPQVIERLGKLLQGRSDVLALTILWVYFSFKDSDALPFLIKYRENAQKKGIKLPGIINTGLKQALKASQGQN